MGGEGEEGREGGSIRRPSKVGDDGVVVVVSGCVVVVIVFGSDSDMVVIGNGVGAGIFAVVDCNAALLVAAVLVLMLEGRVYVPADIAAAAAAATVDRSIAVFSVTVLSVSTTVPSSIANLSNPSDVDDVALVVRSGDTALTVGFSRRKGDTGP